MLTNNPHKQDAPPHHLDVFQQPTVGSDIANPEWPTEADLAAWQADVNAWDSAIKQYGAEVLSEGLPEDTGFRDSGDESK